jgi:predicted nucleotidyltransferase
MRCLGVANDQLSKVHPQACWKRSVETLTARKDDIGASARCPVPVDHFAGAVYTDRVDAAPLLTEVATRLSEAGLEAVLIGNAAAALQGAPVTTVDFDFFFRNTPRNRAKLKLVARALNATILRPYYPASEMYRVVRDSDGLQLDFMAVIHGLRSFEGVKARASRIEIGGVPVLVASLDDIIRSKRAAGRPRDRAVLEILEKAREEASRPAREARRGRPRERS